ncbi:hypothetical protein [Acaryochloris thomasi]|uniref:hypothetical protein n=1 Tax=Acaryochloris thomasi TaxID=2929456 RepID=UPI000DA6C772|nr:hypothetical protein [Acaryochloris thomasi]
MTKGYFSHSFLQNVLKILLSTLGIWIGREAFLSSVSAQILLRPLILPSLNTESPDYYFDFSEDIFLKKTAEGCVPGKFVHIGRGGLPPRPTDVLTFPAVWHDLRQLPRPFKKVEQRKLQKNVIPAAEIPIEAQNWQAQANKQLALITPNPKSEFSALDDTSTC